MLGQMPAGNLQCQVAPEEDAGHSSGLLRIQMEIAADVRQGERYVRPIDKGDRVHNQRHGDDADPAD